ncbi:MAG: glycosyltransferase family 2 protein [Chloroflexi bacterium]|nr:glycosyltransferase family 2 protein [Chloroflexota bacterium]
MKQPGSPKIIAAMPAYNEAKYVGSLVLLSRQYADEVIVVDDGSKDETARVAELAGATVIRHGQNKGKGVAIQNILAEAARRDADVLVLLDADSQHDPREIPALLNGVAQGFDLVIGSRRIRQSDIPLYRRAGQKVLSYATRVLASGKISDTESGFRALSRRAISEIHLKENGFAVEAEMISEAASKGLRMTEVPVTIIYTADGSTLNPIRHGMGNLNRIAVMISERKPLLFFGMAGGVFILLGIIAGVMVVKTFAASSVLATGTALLSMLFITVGILSLFTGVILNVLAKRIGSR